MLLNRSEFCKLVVASMVVIAATGCATSPRFVKNWSEVRIGMSKAKVQHLLDDPVLAVATMKPGCAYSAFCETYADKAIAAVSPAYAELKGAKPELWGMLQAHLTAPYRESRDERWEYYVTDRRGSIFWHRHDLDAQETAAAAARAL